MSRVTISALLVACALVVVPAASRAEGLLGTSRTGLIELRYTRYTPGIDSQLDPTAECAAELPYARVFGNEAHGLLQFGYERHVLQRFGTLSAGGTIGYFSARGGAVVASRCQVAGSTTPSAGSTAAISGVPEQSSIVKTDLVIIPVQAQATYRLTEWEDLVPLVPVLRLGADYYMWRIYGTDDNVARFEPGQPAEGGTWGWHYTLGVHLLMDYFADSMAADFDRDAGVNSTYLTFEFMHTMVNDFGSSKSFQLGDKTVVFGLSFDL